MSRLYFSVLQQMGLMRDFVKNHHHHNHHHRRRRGRRGRRGSIVGRH